MLLKDLYNVILKDGLRKNKFKNSKNTLVVEATKGSIFGYRTKKDMINGHGFIMTSEEALNENTDKLSHWTPNIYRYGAYADKNRRITKGHSEDNLSQINTFFIDFDLNPSDTITENDILIKGLNEGLMPTLILKTTKGYQAYFVLSEAVYITSKSNFKSLKVAKTVSSNLRKCFNEELPVDLTCNHFGIARIPRTDNIVYIDSSRTYSFSELLNWSYKQEPEVNLPVLNLLPGGFRQVDEPWYNLLMHESQIEGKKALYGRNTVIFTLALANYASQIPEINCQEQLRIFNQNLQYPLAEAELLKTIKSAYSGKYQGANREYITTLCQAWISESLTKKDLFKNTTWYKFKKERKDRKRSHLHEWKNDIMKYLKAHTSPDMAYLRLTKSYLVEVLAIPRRSLDKALESLKHEGKIFFSFKAGKNGGIILADVSMLMLGVIKKNKDTKESYIRTLVEIFEESYSFISRALKQAEKGYMRVRERILLELDTG